MQTPQMRAARGLVQREAARHARTMTSSMMIERIDTPDVEARGAIFDILESYNDAASGRADPELRFGVFVRDATGAVTGGALAVTYWDWTFVELLYLPAEARGGGVGTRLMRAVEREAVRRGCHGIWLDTASFQAPGFYRKLGFTEFARIADYAPGTTRFWFRKTALTAWPDPGLPVVETPAPDDRGAVFDGLADFNAAIVGPASPVPLGLVLRDRPGAPVHGGLWARLMRDWMFIEMLVVPERERGRGTGSRLLTMAEDICRARGMSGVWLDTFSFQALPFYERHGYTVLGNLPDFPAPHRRYLLAKRLDGSPVLPEGAAALAQGSA
jgi:GNAT superfamily N-acetyltransferase